MLAVQTSIGEVSGKAVTELASKYDSMLNDGEFQYGCNEDGIFLLNSPDPDGFLTRTFTLATTDMGSKNPKRGRFAYVGIDTDQEFTLSVNVDKQGWRDYRVEPQKQGLQRLKVPIGRNGQGRYWKFKFTSNYPFLVDQIDALFVIRSSGIRGY